jgi:guanylate kinase
VEERIRNGKTVILVIEVNGAANIKKIYPDSLSIFVMPPSEEIIESRLRGRQTECEADIQKRLAIAQSEMQERVNYDFIIVNDELEKAVGDAYEIIKNHTK